MDIVPRSPTQATEAVVPLPPPPDIAIEILIDSRGGSSNNHLQRRPTNVSQNGSNFSNEGPEAERELDHHKQQQSQHINGTLAPEIPSTSTPTSPSDSHDNISQRDGTTSNIDRNIVPEPSQCCSADQNVRPKKTVLFDQVTVYFFNRSQGFGSIPSKGGSTLGMKSKHFLTRKLSVDVFEEVRRRSRREILLKLKYGKLRRKQSREEGDALNSDSTSSSTSSSTSNDTSLSDLDDNGRADDDDSLSGLSDISDSELESEKFIFLQPIDVKLRRSLLRASGVGRIDPKEKKECKLIRDSRERSGCKCVNQCLPGLCECSLLGVNCHVDRVSFPCGCISSGCQNPLGRTEFDVKRVKGHQYEKLGVG